MRKFLPLVKRTVATETTTSVESIYSLVRLCPEHLVEDTCYDEALQRAWQRLKDYHVARCVYPDCVVDDAHVTINHGTSAVTAHTEFWWRDRRWI